jgi:hypothetical protein
MEDVVLKLLAFFILFPVDSERRRLHDQTVGTVGAEMEGLFCCRMSPSILRNRNHEHPRVGKTKMIAPRLSSRRSSLLPLFIGCKQLAGKAILDRGFDERDLCERVARLARLDRDVIAFLFEILHESEQLIIRHRCKVVGEFPCVEILSLGHRVPLLMFKQTSGDNGLGVIQFIPFYDRRIRGSTKGIGSLMLAGRRGDD